MDHQELIQLVDFSAMFESCRKLKFQWEIHQYLKELITDQNETTFLPISFIQMNKSTNSEVRRKPEEIIHDRNLLKGREL